MHKPQEQTPCNNSVYYLPARVEEEKVAAARRVLLKNMMAPNEG
jgi:hypothetical protein